MFLFRTHGVGCHGGSGIVLSSACIIDIPSGRHRRASWLAAARGGGCTTRPEAATEDEPFQKHRLPLASAGRDAGREAAGATGQPGNWQPVVSGKGKRHGIRQKAVGIFLLPSAGRNVLQLGGAQRSAQPTASRFSRTL